MRLPVLTGILALILSVSSLSFAAEKAAPANQNITGTVVETMNSGGYSYMLVDRGKQKTWVAAPQMQVKVGQKVELTPGMEMAAFTSKTLKRTFDSIIFSGGPAQAAAADQDMMKKAHGSAGVKAETVAAATPAATPVKVEKAKGSNAYTVAEIHEKSGALNKKKVAVRGKVVKVSTGIMGKNWLHLQDGTGSPAKGSNDLVVTSSETATVGDVITATGVVAKDRDFGAGYKYAVVMEEAKLAK